MKDITNGFGHLYNPLKALLIFKKAGENADFYIEAYDMDPSGKPINGHPLSVREGNALSKALIINERKAQGFLIPKGLMPANVLHINGNLDGCAIWHTPAQERRLLFSETLGIPSGTAHVPPLIWRAGRRKLQVFAHSGDGLTLEMPLLRAPFFNVYADGAVCMGNVKINIPATCGLEQFIHLWEDYFFNSFFSHTIHQQIISGGNIVQLWQQLIASNKPFPIAKLIPLKSTLNDLIV